MRLCGSTVKIAMRQYMWSISFPPFCDVCVCVCLHERCTHILYVIHLPRAVLIALLHYLLDSGTHATTYTRVSECVRVAAATWRIQIMTYYANGRRKMLRKWMQNMLFQTTQKNKKIVNKCKAVAAAPAAAAMARRRQKNPQTYSEGKNNERIFHFVQSTHWRKQICLWRAHTCTTSRMRRQRRDTHYFCSLKWWCRLRRHTQAFSQCQNVQNQVSATDGIASQIYSIYYFYFAHISEADSRSIKCGTSCGCCSFCWRQFACIICGFTSAFASIHRRKLNLLFRFDGISSLEIGTKQPATAN